ncbi:MAG: hypothetical protein ACOYMF_17340 [Bacteroidales bacterium]
MKSINSIQIAEWSGDKQSSQVSGSGGSIIWNYPKQNLISKQI